MGVAYYYSWLIQNHKNILENIKLKNKFDILFIDGNSIIYDNINYDNFINIDIFERNLINNVIKKLKNIINKFELLKIMITFDGLPPLAKITQQKNRRYKSNYISKLFDDVKLWDSCSITVGTKFMNKLDKKIKENFNNKNIILSLSNEKGEGEHKIFNEIRKNDYINKDCIIYGLDADLIHLSLNNLCYCKNIYLYRDTIEYIKSLDDTLNPNEEYIISINILSEQIYKILTNKDLINKTDDLYYNKINDYVFICFLLGNDFNPHFPALNLRYNGLDILLELYKNIISYNKTITNKDNIDLKLFKLLISKLAENEEEYIKYIYKIREKLSKKKYKIETIEDKKKRMNELPLWERNIELFINPDEKYWEHRYYTALFNINIDKNKNELNMICNNYLETLLWTYKYYKFDNVGNSVYYKYEYPPLLKDLLVAIPYFIEEIVINIDIIEIKSNTLLSLVLPKDSLNLLPNKIHNYLLNNYKNYYRDDYKFMYAFCKYFWEGHVIFPEIDYIKLINDINNLS